MREPNALIRTDALARDLSRGDLRVFDCTTYLEPPPPGSDDPYIAASGRSSFETAHIPGADFLDLSLEPIARGSSGPVRGITAYATICRVKWPLYN
jgi:thiosulfate/3-mercaptopyruvate sulfurtransferase